MKIADVVLDKREEELIDTIYRHLKENFPLAEYIEREEILGIGEPGRHLMCYFSMNENGLRIKFKGKEAVYPADGADLLALADETVQLFRENEFRLKRSLLSSGDKCNAALHVSGPAETQCTRAEEEFLIMQKLGAELGNIPNEVKSRTFDGCSVRLYNAFRRRNIMTIGDLCAYTPQEIFATRNFGYKCLSELYRFILLAVGKEVEKPYVPPQPSPREIVYERAYADYLTYRSVYEEQYAVLIQCISHIADAKLGEREKTVVFARFGIFEKLKTLQEIGSDMGMTREGIRQIYLKSGRKLLSTKLPTSVCKEICDLAEQLACVPAGGALAFLLLEGGGTDLAEFVCTRFFRQRFDKEKLSTQIKNDIREEARNAAISQKREKFNSEIGEKVIYPAQRTLSEEFFRKLHTEREVENEGLAAFEFEGRTYACESFLEQHVLERFLKNKTFREIKTQSLRILFKQWFYYPDFQCLTHDGRLAIVEVKPLFKMLEYKNIEKFRALRAFCAENGFGYLIIDGANNSFEAIDVHNAEFERQIMLELDRGEELRFPRFHEIYRDTRANIRQFLSLIKAQDLELQTPFLLKRARPKK